MDRKIARYKTFIVRNLSLLNVNRGIFTDRVKSHSVIMKQILNNWQLLSNDQRINLHNNTRYIIEVINRHSATSVQTIRHAGTLPFMQLQGQSHYCGMCAINNLVGKEMITCNEIDNIADDIWLKQSEVCGLSPTDEFQSHRSSLGDHSLDTITEVARIHGYNLEALEPSIRSHLLSYQKTIPPQTFLCELLRYYTQPV